MTANPTLDVSTDCERKLCREFVDEMGPNLFGRGWTVRAVLDADGPSYVVESYRNEPSERDSLVFRPAVSVYRVDPTAYGADRFEHVSERFWSREERSAADRWARSLDTPAAVKSAITDYPGRESDREEAPA